MEWQRLVTAISLLGLLKSVWAQDISSICNAALDCASCIEANPACAWCADADFSGLRCYYSINPPATCSLASRQNPRSELITQSQEELSLSNQITPRSVNVTSRPGDPVLFTLKVQPARNFPLDVYILMDLSYSMLDDLEILKSLGANVALAIGQISTNFQLGFGSFVEKKLIPFFDARPERLADPCLSGCEPTYSYRHVLSLTNNASEFNQQIQERVISGNVDVDEGGFDGFVQAIVCQELIGWRENARHILLFITDAGFHYAGDGKLAGVIRPNPGVCLMDNQQNQSSIEYLEYSYYDYPSIGQISHLLQKFDIIPVFAAESSALEFYEVLANQLEGAEVETLASDSSNILTLLDDTYTKLTQRILISPTDVPGVSFTVNTSNCTLTDQEGNCDGVVIEQLVELPISVSIDQCSEQFLNGPTIINVRVIGFGSFDLSIDALCSCDCNEVKVENATECSQGNGTYVCGICECYNGRFGEFCQCDSNETTTAVDKCPVGVNDQVCSGHGKCVCGQCICDTNDDGTFFFGHECECDNFECPRADDQDGEICGGSSRGTCQCDGTCLCHATTIGKYTGDACDCSPDTSTCVSNMDATAGGTLCSGNGRCECGQCICHNGYMGPLCQTCIDSSTCVITTCNESLSCAMCAANVTAVGCGACSNTQFINEPPDMINGYEAMTCEFTAGSCEYRYYVAIDDSGMLQTIYVNENFACSAAVPTWAIGFTAITGVVLVTLLLILVLVVLKYILLFRKLSEQPKQENLLIEKKERENAIEMCSNPIYGGQFTDEKGENLEEMCSNPMNDGPPLLRANNERKSPIEMSPNPMYGWPLTKDEKETENPTDIYETPLCDEPLVNENKENALEIYENTSWSTRLLKENDNLTETRKNSVSKL